MIESPTSGVALGSTFVITNDLWVQRRNGVGKCVPIVRHSAAGIVQFHEEVERVAATAGLRNDLPKWKCKTVTMDTRGRLKSGGFGGVVNSALNLVKTAFVGGPETEVLLFPLSKMQDGDLGDILTTYITELNKFARHQSVAGSQEEVARKEVERLLSLFISAPLKPDWPLSFGPIDLTMHDGPHQTSRTEWWYLHAHCMGTGADGKQKPLSVFVCFFRVLAAVDVSGKQAHAHAITWAISDPSVEQYYHTAVLDQSTPESCLHVLDGPEAARFQSDPFVRAALREVVAKGNVPLPDRIFDAPVHCSSSGLNLKFGNAGSLRKLRDGQYSVKAKQGHMELDLVFSPRKDPVRHGDHGVVPGKDGDDMFYYFFPRCDVQGKVTIPNVSMEVHQNPRPNLEPKEQWSEIEVTGSGWFDHEFGGNPDEVDVMDFSSSKKVTSNGASTKQQHHEMKNSQPAQVTLNGVEEKTDFDSYPTNTDRKDKQGTAEGEHSTTGTLIDSGRGMSSLDYAWTWVAIQLEKNIEISAAVLYTNQTADGTPSIIDVKAVVIQADGSRVQYSTDANADVPSRCDVIFTADESEMWMSKRTFRQYPTDFRLQVPAIGLDLQIRATFPDQEFVTLICRPAFWEGRCDVTGALHGQEVRGLAYVERNGFSSQQTVSGFFKSVGRVVRKSAQEMYPLNPTLAEATELVASKETAHYMDGVPLDILGEKLMGPVRLVADRGGKSWRSYGALACVDCVGGDSRGVLQWIAFPEFLHVGSLIIDDIQDRSLTRRGGACAHLVYGEPLSINAGTAAYFLCERLIKLPTFSKDQLLRFYDLYFAALRGGHAGQALDIHGNDHMMSRVVQTGDPGELERRILAIHRLKTAVPAGTLARMGAVAGGGTEEQIESLGMYFESVGLAFQIMDDVLNLRGLYAKSADKLKPGTVLKNVGEDIAEGKVTMPVCKAMGLLKSKQEREKLWSAIQAKPQEQEKINEIIAQLERLGAIDICVRQADELVASAWNDMDPVIPDSFAKMMLRAFGWFVVERCG